MLIFPDLYSYKHSKSSVPRTVVLATQYADDAKDSFSFADINDTDTEENVLYLPNDNTSMAIKSWANLLTESSNNLTDALLSTWKVDDYFKVKKVLATELRRSQNLSTRVIRLRKEDIQLYTLWKAFRSGKLKYYKVLLIVFTLVIMILNSIIMTCNVDENIPLAIQTSSLFSSFDPTFANRFLITITVTWYL